MRPSRLIIAMVFLTAGILVGGASPTAAANIANLKTTYSGAFHSNANPAFENSSTGLVVSSTNPSNGVFVGMLAGLPVNGKVTGNGKVTFSGSFHDGPNALRLRATGQLSATGLFIIGSVTIDKTAGNLVTEAGKYTLVLSAPEL
jgi:hypothetical protein